MMLENLPLPVLQLISLTFSSFKEGPFVTKTVGEILWGYDSKLLDFLNNMFPSMMPFKGKFGLFVEVCMLYFLRNNQRSSRTIRSKHLAGKTLNLW